MKKIISIAIVAVMLLAMGTVSAFAKVSPTAKPITDDSTGTNTPGSNGSSTSPQTGDSAVLFCSLSVLMAAAASVLAVKKIKE